jgi:hypothetical protein
VSLARTVWRQVMSCGREFTCGMPGRWRPDFSRNSVPAHVVPAVQEEPAESRLFLRRGAVGYWGTGLDTAQLKRPRKAERQMPLKGRCQRGPFVLLKPPLTCQVCLLLGLKEPVRKRLWGQTLRRLRRASEGIRSNGEMSIQRLPKRIDHMKRESKHKKPVRSKSKARRAARIKGLCAAAAALGVHRTHLYLVLSGRRESASLRARYEALVMEGGAA